MVAALALDRRRGEVRSSSRNRSASGLDLQTVGRYRPGVPNNPGSWQRTASPTPHEDAMAHAEGRGRRRRALFLLPGGATPFLTAGPEMVSFLQDRASGSSTAPATATTTRRSQGGYDNQTAALSPCLTTGTCSVHGSQSCSPAWPRASELAVIRTRSSVALALQPEACAFAVSTRVVMRTPLPPRLRRQDHLPNGQPTR